MHEFFHRIIFVTIFNYSILTQIETEIQDEQTNRNVISQYYT